MAFLSDVKFVHFNGTTAIVLDTYPTSDKKDTLYDLFVFAALPYAVKGVRALDIHGKVEKSKAPAIDPEETSEETSK